MSAAERRAAREGKPARADTWALLFLSLQRATKRVDRRAKATRWLTDWRRTSDRRVISRVASLNLIRLAELHLICAKTLRS